MFLSCASVVDFLLGKVTLFLVNRPPYVVKRFFFDRTSLPSHIIRYCIAAPIGFVLLTDLLNLRSNSFSRLHVIVFCLFNCVLDSLIELNMRRANTQPTN